MERVQNTRLVRQAWEAWKKRLRHHGDLEGLSTVFVLPCICHLTHWLVAAALAFAQRSQTHVTSSAIEVWHKRLATQQGAQAFAVQYANVQLQFRLLFKWRVRLRAHLKLFRQAKIADKFFVMRRAWRIWVDKAEKRAKEKRLREWNAGRAGKIFAGTSRLQLGGSPSGLKALGPVGWKEKALRLRRLRLAEQQIQSRVDTVGLSLHSVIGFSFSLLFLTARTEGRPQPLDKSRHRGEAPRTGSRAAKGQGNRSVSSSRRVTVCGLTVSYMQICVLQVEESVHSTCRGAKPYGKLPGCQARRYSHFCRVCESCHLTSPSQRTCVACSTSGSLPPVK